MKRYKHLWDDFISMENLELAAKKAVKSKKSKPETKFFLAHKQELLQKLLSVLHNIIFSCGDETNLPIGNLTSQWMGNVYLNELDHFVKEELKCRDYIRYCDDFCVFENNKLVLHDVARKIKDFIENKLAMRFSKCVLRQTNNGVSFIGYRHFKKFILIRNLTRKKIKRRIMNIFVHHDCGQTSLGQLAAVRGWLKWCNSYNFRKSVYDISWRFSLNWFSAKYLI